MSEPAAFSALAPFRVRSYRYQWPADLATSWAFEMETLILSWYVLVETGSVLLLTLFASLQYLGTLISPLFGVVGDRIGMRTVLSLMRVTYTLLASTLMVLIFTGVLGPVHVFVVATIMGLVRPSDMGMRAALVGDTMPAAHLVGAMGIQRTTSDSARVAGALAGAGIVATLGMGAAYVVISILYAVSFLLTLRVAHSVPAPAAHGEADGMPGARSPWGDLRDAAEYVWNTPHLLATMCLAFLVNFTAYPLTSGLMPYVAREIYGTDQTGLGYLTAGFAGGALAGSIALSRLGGGVRAGRMMIIFCATWHLMLLVFVQMPSLHTGVLALVFAGLAQSLGMVPMSAMLLRNSDPRFRGRVMGVRILAIYGLPLGLLLSGQLIERFGYPAAAALYCVSGAALTVAIGVRWRAHLWRADATANKR